MSDLALGFLSVLAGMGGIAWGLSKIYQRLGCFGARLNDHDRRLANLERSNAT